jgi:hypothetical protein
MTARDLSAPIHLVACCATKLDRPARAADLYRSDWFTKARAYIEATGTRWFILSAAHGLVRPGQRLDPYDVALAAMTSAQRLAWTERVIVQLRRSIDPRHCGQLVFLAGLNYREHLMAFAGARARVPMAGLGIGEQKAWLIRESAALQSCADLSDAAVTDHVDPTHADGLRVSPWSDIAGWFADLDRQSTTMAPRRKLYRRFETKARQLTPERIRASTDAAAINQLVKRLSDARYPSGTLHGLEHAWRRDELGPLIVEATNRRTLLELGRDRPHEKGPRLDPGLIPDHRLDHLIQTHRDIAVVERLRTERQRRAGCQLSAP